MAPVVADPEAFAAEFAAWLLDRAPEPAEQRWLAAMHLATPRHVAESLLVSAMFSDYSDLARSLNSNVPFANAVRRDWLDQAEPWLSAHAPDAVLWAIPSHLGFWDSPGDFNERLTKFLDQQALTPATPTPAGIAAGGGASAVAAAHRGKPRRQLVVVLTDLVGARCATWSRPRSAAGRRFGGRRITPARLAPPAISRPAARSPARRAAAA